MLCRSPVHQANGSVKVSSVLSILLAALLTSIFASTAGAESRTTFSKLAAPCLSCHSLTSDSSSKVGPSLEGVAGRVLGADENYTYSQALASKASEGLRWDRATLDKFLEQPQAVIEGTTMSYTGVPDDVDRKALIDWLFSDPSADIAEPANANFLNVPAVQQVLEFPADIAYGEYLAGECLTCHQIGNANGQVPPIHKLPQDYFIHVLLEYQSGARSSRVMQTIARALGAEEMVALSAVFAQME